jgi:quercetin dioxygenase-like cupin family protein
MLFLFLISVDHSAWYRQQVGQNEEIAAEAALFALGQLDSVTAREFEERLGDGSAEVRAEYAEFLETAAHIGLTIQLHTPPPSLRGRLLARIAAEVQAASHSTEMKIVRRDETPWQRGPAPGVEIRLLRGGKTMLVRLAPGAKVPAHPHPTSEQCLVVSGTLTDGETTVHEGDYVYMEPGSQHRELTSAEGCTFLIVYA